MLLKKIVKLIKRHYLFVIFLTFVVALIFLTYKNYGITWDEVYYVNVGRHYVIQIFNALKIPHNLIENGFHPTELHLQTHGVFFDVLTVLITPLFRSFNFETYHLIKALLAVLSLIFLYGILLKMFSRKWALFGMILLLLFPRFYGDIFNNSIDVPTLTIFTIYICLFFHFINKRDSFLRLILLSFSLSILINQRIIFLYAFLLTCVFLIKKPKLIFLLSIFTFIFLHLTHPYLWQHPVSGFFDVLKTSNSFPFTAGNLFGGQFIMSNQLPWDYIPRLMAITTPLSTLGLFIIGNYYLLFLILNKKTLSDLKKKYIYLLSLFYIPLIIVITIHPSLYDSWRHFLFLVIPFIIIAVFGAYFISKIKNYFVKIILFVLITINLFQTVFEMKALHPYQYIYYNSLVGGLKGADGKYETDYWGASYKEAVEWFNKNINNPNKTYYIATQGDPLSSTYYFKKNMIFTDDYNKVNYIISFTRWNSDQKFTGKTIYKVEREGVPLVYIKEFP
ncbi:MAG: glycosyltransferase family 39 protein [Patescibacteria group bacterium]